MKFLSKRIYLLRHVRLLALCAGMMILFSCNFDNLERKNKYYYQCKRQLLKIETFINLSENRLSFVENTIDEILSRDSMLTDKVLGGNFIKEYSNNYFEKSQKILDSIVEKNLAKTSCIKFEKEKTQLIKNLAQIKKIETKCDNYILLMDKISSKDSLYRNQLNLGLVPFELLYKTKTKTKENVISELNYVKQVDKKLAIISIQVYYISRSQNEIIEYLK
jgi:hypothetical protein